jgi:Ca-activated chloride channel family protein
VTLDAPETVEQGATIRVDWEGPGGRYDKVQIFDSNARNGKGKVVRDKRLRNDDFDNRRVVLPAPARTGTYELRYWNGDDRAVLATRAITVVATGVSLSAPDRVTAGTRFVVEWRGPGARYDEVQVVDGNGKKAVGRRLRNAQFDERKASIKAPAAPGQYELRYWNGDNKAVLATRPLTVE